MSSVFFDATKETLNNITAMFDIVWPITAGLWHLRTVVTEEKNRQPNITDKELAQKLTSGSGIHGVNYSRAFIEHTWESQQQQLAWILLNNTIAIYEGWLEKLKDLRFNNMNVKNLQNPGGFKKEIKKLLKQSSAILTTSLYPVYHTKKDNCYGCMDALLHCYRVFKEARNCYMHNGLRADDRLIDEFAAYTPFATPSALNVSEVPEFPTPQLGQEIQISLRGVVGFSAIVIKIIVSIDTELVPSMGAEEEFVSRYKEKHRIRRTLTPNKEKANEQVKRYVQQCDFLSPLDIDNLTSFLIKKSLISR